MPRSRTRSDRKRIGLALSLAAALAACACPFTPRRPHDPCTPGEDPGCKTPLPVDPPFTPDIAFENIRKALLKRGFDGPNIFPNYDVSLADSFLYIPDADAAVAAATRPCQPYFPWVHGREVRFMQNVLEEVPGGASAAPDTVVFVYLRRQEEDVFPDPDRTRYNIDYQMTLVFRTPGSPRRVECYTATALWDFNGGSRNDWRLLRWEDLSPLQNPSCAGGSLGRFRAVAGQCE